MKKKMLEKTQIQKLRKILVNRETITYLVFGVLTTIIGFGTYWLFSYIGMGTITANSVSSAIAVLFAFITNKIFVFKSSSWKIKTALRELGSFVVGRLATYLMETIILYLLVDTLGFNNLICKGLTMVMVVIGNYIISKFAVFRK